MSRHRGLSLLDVLLAAGIFILLVGILLPALTRHRATGSVRPVSVNNLRQIALATHSYHDARRTLPDAVTPPDGTDNTKAVAGAFVKLLPFLEQEALYQAGMSGGVKALTVTVRTCVTPG